MKQEQPNLRSQTEPPLCLQAPPPCTGALFIAPPHTHLSNSLQPLTLMASGDLEQQMPLHCGQSSLDTAGWGFSMRLDFPNGGDVASEAPWEGRWREAGSQAGLGLCECGRRIVPQLCAAGLDGADLEILIRERSGLPGCDIT